MIYRPLLPRKPADFNPVIKIHNYITLDTPPIEVIRTYLDATTWPAWNTYTPTAKIYYTPLVSPPYPHSTPPELTALFARSNYFSPGCKFTMTHSDGTPPSNFEIDEIYKISTQESEGQTVNGFRVVARIVDVNTWFFNVVRIQDFTEIDGGTGTRYDSWTEIGGAGAWLAKFIETGKKIERLFDETFLSFKEFVESGKGNVEGDAEVKLGPANR